MVSGESYQQTRDNIGNLDDTRSLVLLGPLNENVVVEEGPTQLTKNNVGSSFVLGLATNAVLGTTVLGETDYVVGEVMRVVNPNNIFHEHFRFDDFEDSTNGTGTLDTTNFNYQLDNGEIFQTLSIFLNEQSPLFVNPTITIGGGSTTFTIVKADGGKDISVTEGVDA